MLWRGGEICAKKLEAEEFCGRDEPLMSKVLFVVTFVIRNISISIRGLHF
jgi:hypothetical protein